MMRNCLTLSIAKSCVDILLMASIRFQWNLSQILFKGMVKARDSQLIDRKMLDLEME